VDNVDAFDMRALRWDCLGALPRRMSVARAVTGALPGCLAGCRPAGRDAAPCAPLPSSTPAWLPVRTPRSRPQPLAPLRSCLPTAVGEDLYVAGVDNVDKDPVTLTRFSPLAATWQSVRSNLPAGTYSNLSLSLVPNHLHR
jgi:hypothetical protein